MVYPEGAEISVHSAGLNSVFSLSASQLEVAVEEAAVAEAAVEEAAVVEAAVSPNLPGFALASNSCRCFSGESPWSCVG